MTSPCSPAGVPLACPPRGTLPHTNKLVHRIPSGEPIPRHYSSLLPTFLTRDGLFHSGQGVCPLESFLFQESAGDSTPSPTFLIAITHIKGPLRCQKYVSNIENTCTFGSTMLTWTTLIPELTGLLGNSEQSRQPSNFTGHRHDRRGQSARVAGSLHEPARSIRINRLGESPQSGFRGRLSSIWPDIAMSLCQVLSPQGL